MAEPGVLANDVDNGGGAMAAVLLSQPTNGTVALNSDGSFTYAPTAPFVQPETFTYRADNAAGQGTVAVVSLYALPQILAAKSDAFSTTRNSRLAVPGPGVLANDSAGAGASAVMVTSPAHGELRLRSNGGFAYVPHRGFSGTDTFTYRITNGVTSSRAATVTISVVARRAR